MFQPPDLEHVGALLAEASAVVAMEDIYCGNWSPTAIGMRHDVDDNPGSLETAVKLARWEAERGYRSTFFILHSASYWNDQMFEALDAIVSCGHEIGIHASAIATALRDGGDPGEILLSSVEHLRALGYTIRGVAAHGDELCRLCGFVNDEQFAECARPEMGEPDRVISFDGRSLKLAPRPLADFGLLYDTHRLRHGRYLSDSGGSWNEPFPGSGTGQLHILMHPDWWGEAFTTTSREVISV